MEQKVKIILKKHITAGKYGPQNETFDKADLQEPTMLTQIINIKKKHICVNSRSSAKKKRS